MKPHLLLTLALAACHVDLDDPGKKVLDQRVEWTTDRENTIAFFTPDYEVPPYTDQTMCVFDTYEGGEVAIPWAGFYQNLEWGHHVVLMASEADEDDWPDGTIANCTDANADIMIDSRPFLFAADLSGNLQPEMVLPEGMAVKLNAGERFVIQSHHINTTDKPILVNDAVFLQTEPIDVVETWAAPWVHTQTDFSIAPGETRSEVVDCTFDQDVTLLSLLGHMHEWGVSYAVDHFPATTPTSAQRIYDIPSWDVAFRDAPPIETYAMGQFPVAAGDRFVTTCTWENTTDAPLEFPHEMCATVGFAYPLLTPVICEP